MRHRFALVLGVAAAALADALKGRDSMGEGLKRRFMLALVAASAPRR